RILQLPFFATTIAINCNWSGVIMLTEQIKSLIENECALSPRLTGVFFRKHLNQSMYDDDGQLCGYNEKKWRFLCTQLN
ncbi:hypothetical protein, partial [Vibrio parahaemolyticus]|uniref:hypothetical protein n=1 Tax=Vibrio parahaemolyticus TaxID=670 RepID=UPI001C2FADDD